MRGDLLAEEIEGFLTRAADFFVNPRGPGLHLFVHPVGAAFAIDDADAFADGVEDEIGLLADEGAFEGEEIGGFGKDGGELIGLDQFDGFVDGVDLLDITTRFETLNGCSVSC